MANNPKKVKDPTEVALSAIQEALNIGDSPSSDSDRDAIREEFGDDYQAFNVDVWAFPKSAKVISTDERDQQQKLAALVYYNLATALVLVGPSLRVVHQDPDRAERGRDLARPLVREILREIDLAPEEFERLLRE